MKVADLVQIAEKGFDFATEAIKRSVLVALDKRREFVAALAKDSNLKKTTSERAPWSLCTIKIQCCGGARIRTLIGGFGDRSPSRWTTPP